MPKVITENDYEALVNASKDVESLKNQIKDAAQNYDAKLTEQATLHTEIVNSIKVKHEKEVADLKANSELEITNLKLENDKVIADLKAEFEKQISDEKAKVILAETSAEVKAMKTIAKFGMPEADLPKVTNEDNSTQILEKSSHLKGEELSKFYIENKDAIRKAFEGSKKKD